MSPWKSEGKNMVTRRGILWEMCAEISIGNLELTHGRNVAGNIK